jgi:CHAT domain-containing protein
MNQLFSLLFLLSCCLPLTAQPSTDTIQQLLSEAVRLNASNDYEAAATRAERALNQLTQQPSAAGDLLAEARLQLGTALALGEGNPRATALLEEAVAFFSGRFPEGSAKEADGWFALAFLEYQYEKNKEALLYFQRCNSMRTKVLPADDPDLAVSLRLEGNSLLGLGRLDDALYTYEQSLCICSRRYGPESLNAADVIGNMGYAYWRKGDFETSIALQEKALLIRKKQLPPQHVDIAMSCHNLGMNYKSLYRYDRALAYLREGLDIRQVCCADNYMLIASSNTEMGNVFLAQRNTKAALTNFSAALQAMTTGGQDKSGNAAYVCSSMGRACQQMEKPDSALYWYDRALAIFLSKNQQAQSNVAQLKMYQSNSLITLDRLDEAWQRIEEAAAIWTSVYGPDNAQLYLTDAAKGRIAKEKYLRNGQEEQLLLSRQYHLSAANRLAESVVWEKSESTRSKTLADAKIINERAIQVALLPQPDQAGLEQISQVFRFMETSHSLDLNKTIQESKALHFSGIPDSLLAAEAVWKEALQAALKARQQLIERKNLPETDTLVLAAALRIHDIRIQYQNWLSALEKSYPRYFNAKHDLRNISLEQVQQALDPNTSLVEFFCGDSSVTVVVINKTAAYCRHLPHASSLQGACLRLREGMTAYFTATNKAEVSYEKTVLTFHEQALLLYRQLIEPIRPWLQRRLVIVPDAALYFIPFEALLTGPARDPANFGTYPFLQQYFDISYAPSAKLWADMMQAPPSPAPEVFLGMAPYFLEDSLRTAEITTFSANRDALQPLPFSGEEILRAYRHLGEKGRLVYGKSATAAFFRAHAGRYRVLHLGTHGKADVYSGILSYLSFSASDQESDRLEVADVYNLPLRAELVCLSACETGLGELRPGEGVVSLARAFTYAGARSLLTALWRVNDRSSMELMDLLYAELAKGKAKNVALAEAKRRFVQEKGGRMAHPYFWAGFILNGSTSPLSLGK